MPNTLPDDGVTGYCDDPIVKAGNPSRGGSGCPAWWGIPRVVVQSGSEPSQDSLSAYPKKRDCLVISIERQPASRHPTAAWMTFAE